MLIYEDLKSIKKINNSIVTIGSFDGIHKGHLFIFNKMKKISNANMPRVIISFNPHPKTILKNNKNFEILNELNKKIKILKEEKVDILVLIPFDYNFSKMDALEFLEKIIINYFNPSFILIGYDHHFGHNKEGNYKFLKKNENIYNYNTIKIDAYKINGTIVSSSIIRKYIKKGQIYKANNFLGWNYEIKGIVIKGSGRGKSLNYPTANIKVYPDKYCIPLNGVYAITAKINGNKYKGMCNIGYRPTFDDLNEPIIEVNLFHIFKNDFYQKKIIIIFNKYIRKEIKFKSKDELICQLRIDKKKCININN